MCCLHRSLPLESLSWGSLQQYGIHHPHCPRPHWIPPWSSRETDSPVAPPPNQSQHTANLKIITKHKKWFFIGFDGSMKDLCTTIAPKVLCRGLCSSQNGSLKNSSLKGYLGNLKVVIWHHCENGLLELLFKKMWNILTLKNEGSKVGFLKGSNRRTILSSRNKSAMSSS